MPVPPLSVYERPFAVDPITKLMMPDGIFDTFFGEQLVGVYYTAESFDPYAWGLDFDVLVVSFSFEVSPESGIVIEQEALPPHYSVEKHGFVMANREPSLKPGQQSLNFFKADFSHALPGKHRIRFKARVSGRGHTPGGPDVPVIIEFPQWDIYRDVFVTQTTLNEPNKTVDVKCPEGTLRLHTESMHLFPYVTRGHSIDHWPTLCMKRIYDPVEQRFTDQGLIIRPPLMLPKTFTLELVPNEAYLGACGAAPFSDVWWKVLGWIATAILAGVAGHTVNVGYMSGDPKDPLNVWRWSCDRYYSSAGSGVEEVCGPVMDTYYQRGYPAEVRSQAQGASNYLAMGITVTTAVGCMDEIDPFRAGEMHSPPPSTGESTLREVVTTNFEYIGNPIPGAPYRIRNQWSFKRHTNQDAVYTYEATWEAKNNYLVVDSRVNKEKFLVGDIVDDQVEVAFAFRDEGGRALIGSELYVFVLIVAPTGSIFFANCYDREGTGTYTARFSIVDLMSRSRDGRYVEVEGRVEAHNEPLGISGVQGRWDIGCIAQSVNNARPDEPQEEQAKKIGGKPLSKVWDAHLWEDCKIKLNKYLSFEVEYILG